LCGVSAHATNPSDGVDRDDGSDTVEATRRTRLAAERTYLAWWRTGLTAIGLAVAAGRVVPALTKGARWPYTIVGVGYALLGAICIGYAAYRRRVVEDALSRGGYAPADDRVVTLLTVGGTLLALIVLVVVAVEA
jgi:putative membrane protein